MKIVYDHEIFYQQIYGGISSYFTNLGLELLKQDININFVCPIHKNKNLSLLPKKNIIGKKLIYPSRLNRIINLINSYLSNQYYQKINPNIIHKTYFSDNKTNLKYKNVITFYDVTHELNKNINESNKKIMSMKMKNIKSVDHIICPSNQVKFDLMNYYNIEENKISVTYFSSDYEKVSETELSKKKKYINYLLYVGNRSGYKNFNSLVSAFVKSDKLKKDFKVLVFGGEKPSIYGKKLVENARLPEDTFKFISGTNEDLKFLYKNVRALIYTSSYEGFGIPLVEAMRSGCPVITSNGGALNEVGGEGLSYFNPNNDTEIKEKIENMVYSEDNIKKAINYGLSRCDLFSWTNCASKTLEVYKKLL